MHDHWTQPTIFAGGGAHLRPVLKTPLSIAVDAWNIVKSDDAAATFDVTSGTKGPVSYDVDSGAAHWLFAHFEKPTPNADYAVLWTLGDSNGDAFILSAPVGGGTGQARVRFRLVTAEWTPSALTWSNKPATSIVRTDNFVGLNLDASEQDAAQKVAASGNLTAKRIVQVTSSTPVVYGAALSVDFSGSPAGFSMQIVEATALELAF